MSAVFNVLIVGAGKIGALFDNPKNAHILTHAHAFVANKNFHLVGFVDADISKAKKAAGIWGCKAFSSVGEAFKMLEKVDVAVVATPDETHETVLKELLKYSLKLICMEKPLAGAGKKARALANLCRRKRLPVLVNYPRRFVKEFRSLQKEIKNGFFGNFLTGVGYYGKGILHNGSHMVDLVRFLIGEVSSAKPLSKFVDFSKNDPSVSARLTVDNGHNFFLHAVDSRVVTVFEMDLFFEKARVRMVNSGFFIERSAIGDSPVFSGYRVFSPAQVISTSLDSAMAQVVENAEGYLLRGETLLCGLEDGCIVVEVCGNLAKQVRR